MSGIQTRRHAPTIRGRAVAPMLVALLAAALLLLGAASQGGRAWADEGGQLAAGAAADTAAQPGGRLEAQAATGYRWELTSSYCELRDDDVGEYHRHWYSQFTPQDGSMIGMKAVGGYYGDDYYQHCNTFFECQKPPAVIPAGGKVTLKMNMYTTETRIKVSGDTIPCVHVGSCVIFRDMYSNNAFVAEDGSSDLYIGDTPAGKPYSSKDNYVTKTVSQTMPEESYVGLKQVIRFSNPAGNYVWEYTLKEIAPAKAQVVAIKNVKGAKAKVTVKAVKGAQKYQVRYKVGSAKAWKTVKAKESRAFTVKVAKGKKVKAQARAWNTAGWGAWGKVKSFKTDKK